MSAGRPESRANRLKPVAPSAWPTCVVRASSLLVEAPSPLITASSCETPRSGVWVGVVGTDGRVARVAMVRRGRRPETSACFADAAVELAAGCPL